MSLSLLKPFLFVLVAVCAVGLFSFSGSTPVLAGCDGTIDVNDPLGVNCVGASGLTKQPIGVIVGRLIQVALSLVGTVFLVLILWAGFRWMTDAGSEDNIKAAKKTLTAAVIGLLIVLTAYSLTSFIIDSLYTATMGR